MREGETESEKNSEEGMPLFWNLIYYFNEYSLPFDLILPYEEDTFEKEYREYRKQIKKQVTFKKEEEKK